MDNLDEFVLKNGEEITEDYKLVSKEKIMQKLNNPYAYDSNTPIPGENLETKLEEQVDSINENNALSSLIQKAAYIKAKQETEDYKTGKRKISKEEMEKLKPGFVEQLLYQQQEDYYNKYHHIMDGKTKRRTKKIIERNFDKGRYNKYLINNHTGLNG